MNDQPANDIMTNREFVAIVRAKLDAAGHRDIAIERSWIDEHVPGYNFLLNVPVGTEFVLPLKAMEGMFNKPAADVEWEVGHFVAALVNLQKAERMLIKYGRDVRRAANEQIALAREEGLELQLDNVGFKPTYAYHLSGKEWKDAAYHVLAAVKVRHTSFYLQPEVSEIWVEEAADVAEELRDIRGEQAERQARIRELEALGADLEVDAITLEILSEHGLVAEEVLRSVWKKQCLNLKVEHLGREATLSLVTWDGRVSSSLHLEDAYWNGEHLWLLGDENVRGHEGLMGKCLGDLVQHPVFTSRPIVKVMNVHGERGRDLFFFDMAQTSLFDADTGRIWPVEVAMAA